MIELLDKAMDKVNAAHVMGIGYGSAIVTWLSKAETWTLATAILTTIFVLLKVIHQFRINFGWTKEGEK